MEGWEQARFTVSGGANHSAVLGLLKPSPSRRSCDDDATDRGTRWTMFLHKLARRLIQ